MKNTRLKLIHKDTQDAINNRNSIPVQQPGFDHTERYSANDKINSIVRTLVALYGKENLLRMVTEFTFKPEGQALNADECYELFQAVKWATRWESGDLQ
jgi:hypothetical protein